MIRVEADPAHPLGGYARITVPGMAGRSVAMVAIGREGYGADSLGPDGWQVASARLVPEAISEDGADLVVILGPSVVEHLEAGPLRFSVPELGLAVVVMWPDIAPLPAAARGGFAGMRPPPPAKPPAPPPLRGPEPLPAPDPEATVVLRPPAPIQAEPPRPPPRAPEFDPSQPAAPGRGRGVMLLLLLLIALAGAGGAAWWYREPLLALFEQPMAPVTPTPPPAVVEAPAVDDGIDRMTPAEIAALNLPPARVLAIAEARQASGRHQDALLLLEIAAAAPYGPAMSALARLYDPATFTPGGALSVPNAAKAAQYWRAAELAGDPAAAPARAALRTRLEASTAAGDAVAAIALQDNWP